jgi:hypothetical protein
MKKLLLLTVLALPLFSSHSYAGAALPPSVSSINGQTGSVTLNINSLAGVGPLAGLQGTAYTAAITALGFTPYNASNPLGFVNATGAAAAAPVQKVVGQVGNVTAAQIYSALNGSVAGASFYDGALGAAATATANAALSASTTPVTDVGIFSSCALLFPTAGSNAYDITLTQNLTLSLTGGTLGQWQRLTLILREPVGGGLTVTLPTNVKWSGGTAPTVGTGASQVTVITFGTDDGGITYFGGL